MSDTYILIKRIVTVNNTAAADAGANNTNKKKCLKIVLHLLSA